MPELPEVETVRRGIEPALLDRRIVRAEARRADLRWPLPERLGERLSGRTPRALRRRSKYILVDLDDGETWIIHLGMTGRFHVAERGGAAAKVGAFVHETPAPDTDALGAHDHVVLETDAHRLVYNDVRRFGAMDLWPTEALDQHKLLAAIGPEPLEEAFNTGAFARAVAGKTASIKAALLDQKRVAGVGNIYACEALWRAGVRPDRAAGSLSRARLDRLVAAVKAVLADAIEAGGSTLRDYRHADGALGYFQHAFAVYGRAGEPCRRDGCGGEVVRVVQTGRSSFYCPRCQR